jgi:hypothetical protein
MQRARWSPDGSYHRPRQQRTANVVRNRAIRSDGGASVDAACLGLVRREPRSPGQVTGLDYCRPSALPVQRRSVPNSQNGCTLPKWNELIAPTGGSIHSVPSPFCCSCFLRSVWGATTRPRCIACLSGGEVRVRGRNRVEQARLLPLGEWGVPTAYSVHAWIAEGRAGSSGQVTEGWFIARGSRSRQNGVAYPNCRIALYSHWNWLRPTRWIESRSTRRFAAFLHTCSRGGLCVV